MCGWTSRAQAASDVAAVRPWTERQRLAVVHRNSRDGQMLDFVNWLRMVANVLLKRDNMRHFDPPERQLIQQMQGRLKTKGVVCFDWQLQSHKDLTHFTPPKMQPVLEKCYLALQLLFYYYDENISNNTVDK